MTRVARDRLRHQLDPPAGRRRGPGRGPGPATLVDVVRRMEIVRLGHGVDRTGEIAPEAMARTLAMAGDYAAQCEKLEVERVRFVATSASRDARNAAEFVDGVRTAFAASASPPRWSPGTRRPRCRSAARPAACRRTASTAPTSWSTSAAGPPSSSAAPLDVDAGPVGRHRLRPDDRAAPAQRPADGGRGGGRHRRRRRRDRRGGRDGRPARGVARWSGWPARSPPSPPTRCGCPRYDPARIHLAALPVDQVVAACDRAADDAPRRARRAGVHAPRPGRRHRRRCPGLAPDRRAGAPRDRHRPRSSPPSTTSSTASPCPWPEPGARGTRWPTSCCRTR